MGRTRRKRKHRKTRNFSTCSGCEELVLLNSWLYQQGARINKKLNLATFDDTGRGVLTKRKITPGEELINLPLLCTLNVTTILMDKDFCNIFLENKNQCLVEYKRKVTFQSLMAFYLVFLKAQGNHSKWFVYLKSLPTEYTVPYFLPNDLKCSVDSSLLAVIDKQNQIIKESYSIFENILLSSVTNKVNFTDHFTLNNYEWAYFTVNTRCVYMDLSNIIDLENIENSILNLISDNTKISLCPYLDMINHSANARNETKLMVNRNLENLTVSNVNEDALSNGCFSIYTKNNFDPYTQVFICYGDSHNLKLITEYGFYLPNNDLDYVSLEFDDIISYLKAKSITLSKDQISFVQCHGLNKDLYIDFRGLSFNLYGLLMVVKYYYDQSKDVSRLIYSAAICSDDKVLNDLITPLVVEKFSDVKKSIIKLESYDDKCVILSNCLALMNQYVNILEKFIKC